MDRANIAAQLMEHLCECDSHGYSQASRWGEGGNCQVHTDVGVISLREGDRDCSSAVCDCWQEAIRGTSYEESLDGATYTGNMRGVFVGSGLFEWMPMSFSATRGDIYLNEASHTAMCICGDADNDILGEFCLSETGGIDGAEGDQTGWESYIHSYYDFPWDGILHYNGAADGEIVPECPDASPGVTNTGTRYRVRTKEYGWHDWMEGLHDTGGSTDDFAGCEGCKIYGFDVEGYDYRIVRCDGSESVNDQGNEDSPICGIEIMGDVTYQVHWTDTSGKNGEWGKWEHGSDDNGAGKDDTAPIDMVRCR